MIADQLLKIIKQIHYKSVVHQDLKPENIIFGNGDDKRKLFLIDFGLSKIFKDPNQKHMLIF